MTACDARWLGTCDDAFAAMLDDIAAARNSIRFEIYTFEVSTLGARFLAAFTEAARRGVRVQVLVDAFGSFNLPEEFWAPLRQAGGDVRWFNPITLRRLTFRDHRKLLVCDDSVAFVGGFNVAPVYEGDGVTRGWRDVGLRLAGPLAPLLAESFDTLFERHNLEHPPFTRLRPSATRRRLACPQGEVLLSGPGRGPNEFKQQLLDDLGKARHVRIAAAYFLPYGRLRRALLGASRRGTRIELVLPGKTDVWLAQLATRALYRRFLRAGIEIHEYQPQVLHSKFLLVDDVVYAGSSNLDPRSLHINYELMVRLTDPATVAGARAIFADHLAHSRRIDLREWLASRSWWTRLSGRWACFLLGRLDRWLMRRQLQRWTGVPAG